MMLKMSKGVSAKPRTVFSLGKYITKFSLSFAILFLYWAFKPCGLVLEGAIVKHSRIFRSVKFIGKELVI